MQSENKIKIFIVDDDSTYLKLLEIQFLKYPQFDVETFETGESCIANLSKKPDIVVLDYYLNSVETTAINGLETLDKIKEIDSAIEVIMLSSQDKIEVAVKCLHHKAFDYVVKSETAFMRLLKIISSISEMKQIEKKLNWYRDRM
ncbi:response regulator [Flavobacterium sp.]|uniref:response regulator n=1 Tax=Flavobacterium sp. TaxID=239 RepID=UPI002FDD5B5D